MIQESINQMLGSAAIAGRLSPSYEHKQKLYNLEKETAAAQKVRDITRQSAVDVAQAKAKSGEEISPEHKATQWQNISKTQEDYTKALERQFKENPSPKLYEKLLGAQQRTQGYQSMAQKAMESMQEKGQAAINQDNAFKQLRERIQKDPYLGRTWQRDGGK